MSDRIDDAKVITTDVFGEDDVIRRVDAVEALAGGKGYVMLVEDWLRGCVHHDGRYGEVTLPCDEVLDIADYIESTRNKVEVVRCKDCIWYLKDSLCARHFKQFEPYNYCSYGERGEENDN